MFRKLRQLTSNNKEEEGYRQFRLPNDKMQARLGVLLLVIPIISFVFNDYFLFQQSWLFVILAVLRFSLVAVSFGVFVLIGKAKTYQLFDKIVTLCVFGLMVGGAIINLTRPQNFIVQVILSCVCVFIIYLVIPNRFLYKIALCTTISVGEAFIITSLSSDVPTLFSIFVSLGFTNFTAIVSAWQLEVYRKRSYLDFVKRDELQRSLEQHSKHLEELVTERTEKLKAAERLAAIGATAGMVGHDIRNPLTAITGAVYLSKKELQKLPNSESVEKLKSNLDLIDDQIIYVNKIVFDLQNYAMPLQPNWEKVDLQHMVQSIVLSLKIPSNIFVNATISKEATDLQTDSAYIQRILTNLINNAIQAMSNGGQLTINASAENDKIFITVQDTGEGIAEAAKDKLFTPLFTTKSRGQGFGLAVVKRLTEGLGGTVSFDSEVGKGTKFTINLPQ